MKPVIACAQNEWTKLWASRKYRILPIVAIAIAIGCALIGPLTGSILTTGHYPYTVLSVLCSFWLPLLAFMLAADLMAGEAERGELKIVLTYPVHRNAILLGKLAAMIVYLAATVASIAIAALLMSGFLGGFSGMHIGRIALALLVTTFPIALISSFSLFIAQLSKSATTSFVTCVVTYFGLFAIGAYFSGLGAMLPTGYQTIFNMVIGGQIPWGNFATGMAVLIGYALCFTSAGALRFAQREV